jgi:hypothetical protein
MRARLTVFVAVAVSALMTPCALAGSRKPERPDSGKKVKVTTSGNTVRYEKSRAGAKRQTPAVRVNPSPVHCNYWHTTETTGSGTTAKTVSHRWKQCFSVATGRQTGPPREIPGDNGGTPGGIETWTAVVPDPRILRENATRFLAQRLAYVWLPPEYFNGIAVNLRSSSGAVVPGGATARATSVEIHPGWGDAGNATDCTEQAQFPYDRSVGYWDQRSCALLFMKSSIDEPGGVYTVRATVTWSVTAVVDGEVADPAVVVTEGETTVRVEELQALVTCVGGQEAACQGTSSSKRQ